MELAAPLPGAVLGGLHVDCCREREMFANRHIGGSAENGEHQKLEFCAKMASILHAKGVIPEATPVSVPVDSADAPSWANRTTARCSANRARKELGWEPKTLLEDVFEAEILDILSAVQSA